MRRLLVLVPSVLLFFPTAFGQTNPSQAVAKSKDATPSYQTGTLLKLTARARTQTQELRHTTMTDSPVVSEKIVTYEFTILSGGQQYTSRYTPDEDEQPGNMPHAWWRGNVPVQVKVKNQTLFIKLPQKGIVPSRIVRQAPVKN